ncbi:heavy metal translocating P-type ATPase [Pullulanibacillus sp. KACC 23026]|uniref:heavy metal translocating P-type ATPase n=1 Tax=Pullulanibacillus sp. KACC 23026 TaxID=3028315 RepID=UPI0023B16C7A|nr:heavy metal translocating P-type ATPase [Pullulanibacillus sp. KACC 23026]WEG12766.1 heavy metal translocating P-type ATPase [Pullulanibacillus sp. KACC 23026]
MDKAHSIVLNHDPREKKVKRASILQEHGELIASLASGVLLLVGWLLQSQSVVLSTIIFIASFIIGGYAKAKEGIEETFKEKSLNVELLMFLAAIGSALIGYWWEGGILIFIFSLSGALETYTNNKSKKEISALFDLQPETATLLVDGMEKVVSVGELEIGDRIIVKPGERIPADGEIIKGETTIDEAAITGESLPVRKGLKDNIFAGTININGSIVVEITKKSTETLFQKIIDLVQTAQSEKSPSQLFIERFEDTYVKLVLLIVLLMMVIPHYLIGWNWTETLYRAMVLLVVASPCALVASIMPATLSAISNSAKKGILFKGGVHLERLSQLKAIAFDKTGTLTKGTPVVTDVYVKEGVNEADLLRKVASMEHFSNHPLATAIVRHYNLQSDRPLLDVETIEDVTGSGILARFDGDEWRVGTKDFANQTGDEEANKESMVFKNAGKTVVYISCNREVLGIIALKDTIREETKKTIQFLKSIGIKTILLTGDNSVTAKAIAEEAGVDEFVAECLPEEKLNHIREFQQKYGLTAMVGDGINDAPALAMADVGIAMGAGTDVALETADVVLMKNDLGKISQSIELSKKMNRIVKQNVFFAIAVIVLLIISNFFQAINLPFGVVGHEGSTILVILNGLRLLK